MVDHPGHSHRRGLVDVTDILTNESLRAEVQRLTAQVSDLEYTNGLMRRGHEEDQAEVQRLTGELADAQRVMRLRGDALAAALRANGATAWSPPTCCEITDARAQAAESALARVEAARAALEQRWHDALSLQSKSDYIVHVRDEWAEELQKRRDAESARDALAAQVTALEWFRDTARRVWGFACVCEITFDSLEAFDAHYQKFHNAEAALRKRREP